MLNLMILSPLIPFNIFAICYEVSRRESRSAILWPLVMLILNVLLAWYLFSQSACIVGTPKKAQKIVHLRIPGSTS